MTDLTDEQVETYLEGVRLTAGRIVGRGEQHNTIFITLAAKGYGGEIIDAELGRDALPNLAQRLLGRPGILGYMLVTEQWVALQAAGTPLIPASQAPGRIEIINAQVWTREGEGFCRLWRIEREPPPPRLVDLHVTSTKAGWTPPGVPMVNFYES